MKGRRGEARRVKEDDAPLAAESIHVSSWSSKSKGKGTEVPGQRQLELELERMLPGGA